MRKQSTNIVASVFGAILIAVGVLFAVFYTMPQEVMVAVPFVLGGIGFLSLFSGINGAIVNRMKKNDPKFEKDINDFNDERSEYLGLKAQAKSNEFSDKLYLALILFLAVMEVQLAVLLVFVTAFFLRMFVSLYYARKLNNEM